MQGLDLSPVGLFLEAGLVGKAVMAVLFVASLWCWVLIIEGVVSVVRIRRAVRAARAGGEIAKSLAGVVVAGDEEAHRRIPGETVSEVRARISDAMARAARELLTRVRGRAAQSRRHLVRRAVRRPVRHGLGHHVELRRDRAGAGHEPRDRRARHRRVARRDGLWPRRGDPRLDRLQPHRRRLRPARPGDGVLRRGARDRC